MTANIAEPWDNAESVLDYTDRELEASRRVGMHISDPEGLCVRLAESLRQHWGFEKRSPAVDRAVRIELARAIDEGETTFGRGKYDVGYSIPPAGCASEVLPDEVSIVDDIEIYNTRLFISTTPVVEDVWRAYAEESDQTLSAIALAALKRATGSADTQEQTTSILNASYAQPPSSSSVSSHRDGGGSMSSRRALTAVERLPVIELHRTESRRKVLSWALDRYAEDDLSGYRSGTIAEQAGTSREGVSRSAAKAHGYPLESYGVLTVTNPAAPAPHYHVADTEVTRLLDSWGGYPLTELFGSEGSQKLVQHFLTGTDPDESYSMNQISERGGLNYRTVMNNIETLVEAGLVETVEGSRGTEYSLAADADILGFLAEVNEAVYEHHQQFVPPHERE